MSISEEAGALAEFALRHALSSIVPGGGPLIPFVIVETGGKHSLHRFMGELLEECEANAREFAKKQSGAARVAVAIDGYIRIEGQRWDALIAEASDHGAKESIMIAQRYRESNSGLGAPLVTAPVGEQIILGLGNPLY